MPWGRVGADSRLRGGAIGLEPLLEHDAEQVGAAFAGEVDAADEGDDGGLFVGEGNRFNVRAVAGGDEHAVHVEAESVGKQVAGLRRGDAAGVHPAGDERGDHAHLAGEVRHVPFAAVEFGGEPRAECVR